jgi:hypothetical protein
MNITTRTVADRIFNGFTFREEQDEGFQRQR